ncbi:16S/23S rRNA (cytidine-2'-O)-methyltransferase TlyA [Spatholobus suberectus]|nr:16S/23S rRNA (cytidine-2'-O)-methyltransferase TlyA [Spatholobus suberectus]
MALQFLKHPVIISRGLHNEPTLTFLSRLRNPKLPFTVRWENAQIPTSFRSYATAKSEKVLQVKKWKNAIGKVYVDGRVINKAGTPVPEKALVEIMADAPKYVCRAGHKLEAAIEQLRVDVTGKVALDSGLSTGGLTDWLLQYGASHVYGVDVGYGQVADKIQRDERVSVIERTNLRYLAGLPQNVDLVTLDLSFISILLVMPAVVNVMKENATLVTLVKPQFEARRSQVGKGGIVKDPIVHQEVRDFRLSDQIVCSQHCSKSN